MSTPNRKKADFGQANSVPNWNQTVNPVKVANDTKQICDEREKVAVGLDIVCTKPGKIVHPEQKVFITRSQVARIKSAIFREFSKPINLKIHWNLIYYTNISLTS